MQRNAGITKTNTVSDNYYLNLFSRGVLTRSSIVADFTYSFFPIIELIDLGFFSLFGF